MRPFTQLRGDERAVTAVEFAILAPVICLLLTGAFDVAHTLYARGALQGLVQKTARDSSLEESTDAAAQQALDDKVKRQALAFANNGTVTIKRRYFRTFSAAAAATPEPWTDTNGNGRCDAGEPYQDNNGNNTWDADGGDAGQGGAKDAVLYTVTMTYPRMFPLKKFLPGISSTVTLTASTVLENQPYADQQSYGTPVVRNCP